MTIIWSMIPEMWSTTGKIFCHLAHFLPFYPRNSLKNQNFEKMERTSGDIIILHKCIKNQDHVILFLRYGTWQMQLLLFSLGFLPFYPLTPQKSKFKKNEKKLLEASSFYIRVPKIMIRWCTIPEKWCTTDGQTKKVSYRGGCPT